MNKTIIALIILGLIILSSCKETPEPQFPERNWCREHITELTCDELLECYEWCTELGVINHQTSCRDAYKARLWKCYGLQGQNE